MNDPEQGELPTDVLAPSEECQDCEPSLHPRKRLRSRRRRPRKFHKCVRFELHEEVPGVFIFSFQFGGRDVHGRTETRLRDVALYRVRRAIDRQIRLANAASSAPEACDLPHALTAVGPVEVC